jgi:hypothetical protein
VPGGSGHDGGGDSVPEGHIAVDGVVAEALRVVAQVVYAVNRLISARPLGHKTTITTHQELSGLFRPSSS